MPSTRKSAPSSRRTTSAPSEILETNLDKLHAMADALVKYETIDETQIKDIMSGKAPKPPADWDDSVGTPPPKRPEGDTEGADRHPCRSALNLVSSLRGRSFAMSTAVQWKCRDRILDLGSPVVMGVLNVTPDSFSDGGRHADRAAALAHARRMIDEGAAIIDVGGESTRPGAQAAEAAVELERVIPVIEDLRRESAVFISVDTSKPEVMRAAVAAGADIINDVRALAGEGALAAAAESGAGICLMHMLGEPRTMQDAPHYEDVVAEVSAFLAARMRACRDAGDRGRAPQRRSGVWLRKARGRQPRAAQASRELSKRSGYPLPSGCHASRCWRH